jgi:hypothetical protein
MCCVYDGLEPHNNYEPQQDTNNPIPMEQKTLTLSTPMLADAQQTMLLNQLQCRVAPVDDFLFISICSIY